MHQPQPPAASQFGGFAPPGQSPSQIAGQMPNQKPPTPMGFPQQIQQQAYGQHPYQQNLQNAQNPLGQMNQPGQIPGQPQLPPMSTAHGIGGMSNGIGQFAVSAPYQPPAVSTVPTSAPFPTQQSTSFANGSVKTGFPQAAPVSQPQTFAPPVSAPFPTASAAGPNPFSPASAAASFPAPRPPNFSGNGSTAPYASALQPPQAFPSVQPPSTTPVPGQQQPFGAIPPPVSQSFPPLPAQSASLPRPPSTSQPSATFPSIPSMPQPPAQIQQQAYGNLPIPQMQQSQSGFGTVPHPLNSFPPLPSGTPLPAAPGPGQVQPPAGYQAPPQFGQPNQQQTMQGTNLMNAQQKFGQMNLGSGAQSQMGFASNAASPIVDLLTEKNVMRYGFDDIPFHLTGHMANPEARIDPAIFRSTLYMIPTSEELLNKSRLPFGITLHPFRDVRNLNIIQTSNIVRCRYCRTYINPYVVFPDSRHWRCNLCGRSNDLPDDFSWDPVRKAFGDPTNRPEIQNATVEYIAPNEYMVRPPQPAVYAFILDVSEEAIRTGYLQSLSEQLLINLDMLPGDDRTLVSFVGVDNAIHFFQFPGGNKNPAELVIEDPDDIFLPTNTGLLINLKKNKDAVRWLVQKLPEIFSRPVSNSNALGAALNIVHELMEEIGGRITVFQATLPNVGPGSLTQREDPNQRAADDVQNLGPATDFYKRLALACTGHQVAIDLFMLNRQYADVATLSDIAKYSTGCIYYFPGFDFVNEDYQLKRFEKILTRYLTRKIGFEAVLRIRCSKGLSLSNFHGNFFVRSTDLLSLANVNPDSAIAVQDSREAIINAVMDSLGAYSKTIGQGRAGLLAPKEGHLKYFPQYALTMLKHTAFTAGGRSIKLDERAAAMLMFRFCPLEQILSELYPKLYRLNQLAQPPVGRDENGEDIIEWPQPLPCSFEYVHRDGAYLLETGSALYLYVTPYTDQQFMLDAFGADYNNIKQCLLDEVNNDVAKRVQAFIKKVVGLKFYLGPLIIVKEDLPNKQLFARRLVDDRTESTFSYVEFINYIRREMNK
ncbi:hypothetical protein WR25_12286 [Diploscapter pachys]|uniref:Uncharacterized protein n=1 Tax=Diploscapter pachys TaxID=2018661 RepID=A0A2A2JV80_9BILA|nr:hypothetical protein WR25_12286 [Diploscapter pachys]